MSFAKSIANEELRELPLKSYEGPIHLVSDLSELREVIPVIRQKTILGFDTETRPSFKKGVYHPVSLMQIATDEKVYLFRLNAIGLPDELIGLLTDPDLVKAGLAIHDDLNSLTRLRSFRPGGFVDIQDEVRKLGFENFSLKKIAAIVLGFRISKSQQLSNWDADSLTTAQMTYAATDAWVSLHIYQKLRINGS